MIKLIAQSSRQVSVTCKASKNANFDKPKKILTDFHKKRLETIKLNVNELVKVSQAEVNELRTFIKELDEFHREQLEDIKKSFNKDKKDEKQETTHEDDNENIFLKK